MRLVSGWTSGIFGVAFLVTPVCAQTITFTNLASTKNTEFYDFPNAPALNDMGVVAFTARRKVSFGGGEGLYTSRKGGTYQTIVRAKQGTDIEGFGAGAPPDINNKGVVVFMAYRTVSLHGLKGVAIYKTSPGGKALFPVVRTTIPLISEKNTSETGFWGMQNPCINDAGTVAFMADGRNKGLSVRGVFAVANSHLTTIARTGPEPDFYSFNVGTAINNTGVVLFEAYREVATIPSARLYTASGVRRADAVSTPNDARFAEALAINDAGTVVFTGENYSYGNFVGSVSPHSGRVKILAQAPSPKFADNTTFGGVGINRIGTVAFDAGRQRPDTGKQEDGVYIRLPAFAHLTRVVGTGDTLFGSVVTEVAMTGRGLNDRNQIAFWYHLANGVEGIARADIRSKHPAARRQGRTRSTAAR